MANFLLFFLLALLPSLIRSDSDASVIRRCVKKTGNVSRPSVNPEVCRAFSNAVYCETLFGLENATLEENMDNNRNYKVSKLCYDPTLSILSSRCRSHCNLCCEDPRYDCEDEVEEEACLTLLDNAICDNPVVAETARSKCARTCGLCDQRASSRTWGGATGSLYCADKFRMCHVLHDIVPCNNPLMLCFCAATCRRVNCECKHF